MVRNSKSSKPAKTETASTEETAAQKRERLELGNVTIGVAEDQTLHVLRKSRLDSDPVALAVRDAQPGIIYDVQTEPGKEGAVISILRRAAARSGKGLKTQRYEGLVKFVVGDKKGQKARPAKPEPPVEETPTTE